MVVGIDVLDVFKYCGEFLFHLILIQICDVHVLLNAAVYFVLHVFNVFLLDLVGKYFVVIELEQLMAFEDVFVFGFGGKSF